MKKLVLLISIMMLNFVAFAQEDDNSKYGVGSMSIVDGMVFFSEVVPIEGVTSDKLYNRAKMAVAEIFKSANDVIQLDDKENGVLIVKGSNQCGPNTYVHFTLKIYIKDGKYKVDMTNLVCEVLPSKTSIARKLTAEVLTDDECLNKKGEIKKLSPGYDRKCIIDTKDKVFEAFKKKMMADPVQSADW